MNLVTLTRFILLAMIWGGSFLFMRILAPEVGGWWTAQWRLSIGALVLWLWFAAQKQSFELQHWRHYLIVGVFNCGLPYALFGLASRYLPAGYSAILNSAAPMWATLFAVLMLGERISGMRVLALLLGVAGVALVANPAGGVSLSHSFLFGIAACLLATAGYGFASIYLRKYAQGVSSQAMATLSQAFGALLILPIALYHGVPTHLSWQAGLSALALGVVCSAVALLLYYRLVKDLSGVMAVSVTLFIPLFGILWGALFLGERLHSSAFAGCALIIGGAYLLFRSNVKKTAA